MYYRNETLGYHTVADVYMIHERPLKKIIYVVSPSSKICPG